MNSKQSRQSDKDTNFISKFVFQFSPYWPLFLVLFIIAGAGAWAYLHYSTPIYESTARILIKDEKKGIEDAKSLEALNMLSSKKIIENEIEVIQSRTLLSEVVVNLGLYARVFRDKGIGSTDLYGAAPLAIRAKDPNQIINSKKIYFTLDTKNNRILVEGKNYPLNQWVSTSQGELQFIPVKSTATTSGEFYFTLASPRKATEALQRNLKVTAISKQSSILSLTLRDEIAQRSEDILNALLASYGKAIINDKNTLASNTLKFVEERLKGVEHDLDSIERKIQTYKARTGAIDVSTQGKLFLENVSSNDQRLGEMNMQMAVLNQVQSYVQSKETNAGIVPSTLGVTDPTLGQLVNKLYALELDYESLRKTTGENSSVMVALRDQISKIKPSILENVENQRQGLNASLNNLTATNRQYSSTLQNFPAQEKELIDINRQQSIKSAIYTFLLQKREETALSYAATVPDSRLIDRAESSGNPVSPKPKLIYLSAILGALIVGIGSVTLKESLSRKIMFRHEIEKLTELPIIGEITSETSRDPIVIQNNKKTFIAEQFRKLRNSLSFIGITAQKKRILVTSAISGEGKSFIATNLAISLALTGKRVALLDFDLNNPSINNKLNITNSLGITNYLLGENSVEDIILETDVHPNLFLVPTGKLPENPSELIMNGEAENLLNELDAMFDYIVIDTAPVGPVTDAYVLSPYSDATIYVVRHKYTPKVFVERLDEENKIHKLHNVAIVFNGVEPRGFGNKNYGYGVGYGYIYKTKEQPRVQRLRK